MQQVQTMKIWSGFIIILQKERKVTKKDYIGIADILNQYAICERDNIPFSMDDIVASFASYLAEDNERFDKELFYQRTYRS